MKINIDISVIIPAFNAADSIGVLVHTLLGETTLSTEIIVVDDGSTDETWTVLSAITDERLILICQENQGVYAARNAALAIHRGEWVVFPDADDRVSADFLRERLRTAREARADVVLSMPGIQTAPDICGIPFTADSLRPDADGATLDTPLRQSEGVAALPVAADNPFSVYPRA